MVPRAGCLIIAGALQLALPVYAEEPGVSIVVSRSIAPYLSAAEGAQEVLEAAKVSGVQLHDIGGDMTRAGQLASELMQHPPRVVITVGTEATQAMSRHISDVPIVFSMVVNPEKLLTDDQTLYGATMEVPLSDQLSHLKTLLPNARRVGVLFNPSLQDRASMERRQQAAHEQGLELLLQPVASAAEIPGGLRSLLAKAEALWLIPDETVLAAGTTQRVLLEALRYRIPVLAPSLLFVRQGALLAVSSDYREVGRQAGELAVALLSGKKPPARIVEAQKHMLYLNLRTAKALGVTVPQSLIDQAEQVVQ